MSKNSEPILKKRNLIIKHPLIQKNLFYVSNSDSSKNPQPQFRYRSNMGEHFLKKDANSQRFGNLNNFLNFFSNTSTNISIVIHNNYEQVLTIFIFNWTLRSLN